MSASSRSTKAMVYGFGPAGVALTDLFTRNDWHVTLVDHVRDGKPVCRDEAGDLRIVTPYGNRTIRKRQFEVVPYDERKPLPSALLQAGLAADLHLTTVGADRLMSVVPMIRAISQHRRAQGVKRPFTVLFAENLAWEELAPSKFHRALLKGLSPEEQSYLNREREVRYAMGSIDEICLDSRFDIRPKPQVPHFRLSGMLQRGETLLTMGNAFPNGGPVPMLPDLTDAWPVPMLPDLTGARNVDNDMEWYCRRKMMVFGMGHLLCALLAYFFHNSVSDVLDDRDSEAVVRGAMEEAAEALARTRRSEYEAEIAKLGNYIERMLQAIKMMPDDNVERITRNFDSRKLVLDHERLHGPAALAKMQGIPFPFIRFGLSLALRFGHEHPSDNVRRAAQRVELLWRENEYVIDLPTDDLRQFMFDYVHAFSRESPLTACLHPAFTSGRST